MTLSWDVLIPAYEAEATVAAAVASAFAQRPRPERVLVYDDGSSDRTVERALAAGAEVIAGVENRGVGHARQQLLQHSRAQWILVLDADDRLLPGAGELFSAAVDAHPAGWVLGFGETTGASEPVTVTDLGPAAQVTLPNLWWRNPFISSSTLIQREAAVRTGGFAPVRRLVDYAFWLQLATAPAARHRLWNRGVPVTARAVHGGTITGNVIGAVLAERQLLLQHAPAALAHLPAVLRRPTISARLGMLWWRGLSRHTDYGRPASGYLLPADVVPGGIVPRLLGLLGSDAVRRRLRWGVCQARRVSVRRWPVRVTRSATARAGRVAAPTIDGGQQPR